MALQGSVSPPETGQIVEVRRRRYVVQSVDASAQPDHPVGVSGHRPQHLVSMVSVEDDAYGEELVVVWELEPGAQSLEKSLLPAVDGFDEPERLDAFLDAVRWGAVASADHRSLLSPFRSGIEIEDYQLEPVVRALRMPRVNLLIADGVGLGKTIEAGLVAQELLLRHRARTMLVVCPASLQMKWRDEFQEKFGLEFRIVDSELMRELRRRRGLHANPWTHFPRLITSMDFLKRDRPMRLFREALPPPGEPAFPRRFDLLIVDECHNVAPSGAGRYARDSQRTDAIRTLTPHFEHRLFLSATPHNGYKESFESLLELVDDQRFGRFTPDPEQLRAVMIHRLKSDIPPRWNGEPRFPNRRLEMLEVDYSEPERTAHTLLQRYAASRRSRADSSRDEVATDFILTLLKKRLFSSPAAFASTLRRHRETLSRLPDPSRRPLPREEGILRRMIERSQEETEDDDSLEQAEQDALVGATEAVARLTAEETSLLDELQRWADTAETRADSRARILLRWLDETLRPGGVWNNERVLLFTEYRATQRWLHDLLAGHGFAAHGRLRMLYGGMPPDEREAVKAAFQASPDDSPIRILLATDCASEGIDLQNHCHRMVHLEIPFSPTRLEQRIGRLDRHGQRSGEVLVHHFVPRGFRSGAAAAWKRVGDLEGDLEFLARVAQKVDQIRYDLGKVGPVLADQVQEAMLGRRNLLDTEPAERDSRAMRSALKFERDMRARVAQLRDQLDETRQQLHLTPDAVRRVVEVGLSLARQPGLEPAGGDEDGLYRIPALRGSWTACAHGLAHPHTGRIRPVTFDHAQAAGRDDVVLIHLNHPLVQRCVRLLRAEIWSSGSGGGLHRASVRLAAPHTLRHPVAMAFGRLVILGADHHRLHEEMVPAGGSLVEGKLTPLSQTALEHALAGSQSKAPPEKVRQELLELWPRIAAPLKRALESRSRERTGSLTKQLTARGEEEAAQLKRILEELEKSIRLELEEKPQLELPLFNEPERAQWDRNRDALRRRLERLPEEIARETGALRSRFSDPTPRLFPAAVLFIFPPELV